MTNSLILLLIGLASGFLSGLLGVGGGIIIVPALVLLAGLAPHKAIGISLAVIVPAALSGVIKHHFSGNVEWGIALMIAAGAVVGGYSGATAASHVPGDILRRVFGVFLILIGLNMFFGKTAGASPEQAKTAQNTLQD